MLNARFGLNPIVVVFNNCDYSTQRDILESPLNGYDAATEEAFKEAVINSLPPYHAQHY